MGTKVPSVLLLLTLPVWGQMGPTKVVVVEARMMKANPTVTLVGTVEPIRRSRISAEISEAVRAFPAREGDRVEQGGLICKLNDETLTYRLDESRARLGALQAKLDELRAGTRKQELSRLGALVEEVAAELQKWQFEMKRVEHLYKGDVSNQKEVYETRAALITAEQKLVAARAVFELGKQGPRKETIAQAEHAVAEQASAVRRLEADVARTEIRAPFGGFVVKRTAEVGEWVSTGDNVVELIDLSSVLVRVDVPETALPYVSVGAVSRVFVDALGRSLEGRVKHIVRQADARARTFPVDIELDNPTLALAGGMFVRATLPAGAQTDAVGIPKDAIVERDGTAYVGTLVPGRDGGTVGMLISVTTGGDLGDWIAVTSGNIKPGTQVVTRGNEGMMPFPSPVLVVDQNGVPVMAESPKTSTTSESH